MIAGICAIGVPTTAGGGQHRAGDTRGGGQALRPERSAVGGSHPASTSGTGIGSRSGTDPRQEQGRRPPTSLSEQTNESADRL